MTVEVPVNREPRSAASRLFAPLVYAAFFASGAGSLIAEVTWNRMLVVVVGNSLSATTLILVVFMGGLGLGSFVGGRLFGGRRASMLPYVVLEALVGAYVLLSPALLEGLGRLFTAIAETSHDRAMLTAVRVVVTVAALLVPATLMGATFPAMVSGAIPAGEAARRAARPSYLYAVNTLGAAVGCFFGGFGLLMELGVSAALTASVLAYAFAILSAVAAARVARDGAEAGAAPADGGEPGAPSPLVYSWRFLATATFAIGFVALAYEVVLTRLAILYVGNVVYTFPLVLTAFLLGTGLSATVGTRVYDALHRVGRTGELFGWTAIAGGVAVLAIPYLLLSDLVFRPPDALGAGAALSTTSSNKLWVILFIVAPTALIGALLPLAIRLLEPAGRREATRGAARLYALNTAGGLLGAGIVNYRLVPAIGTQGTLILLAAVCSAVGALGLASLRATARRWLVASGGVAAAVVLAATVLPSLAQLHARKLMMGARAAEVKLIQEGRAATVTVLDKSDPTRGAFRDMYLNGIEEASTRFPHVQLFKLLGMMPVLVHESPQPKDVLVIAFGAGMTAGSTLATGQVRSLDVVDLNPDVEKINDLFTETNGDVFHRPAFHFHNDDGRNYLVTSDKQYDVIASDSTHPRAYDSWILYTAEFYRDVKRRLRPGGVFAQWVPVLGAMQGDLFRIHLNTFRSVFPNATLWYVYGSDQAFLLATPEPFSLDASRLQSRLDALAPWFQAKKYQIDTVARLAGFFWLDRSAMARLIGAESRINTDNFHYIARGSAAIPASPQERLPFFQADATPYLAGAGAAVVSAARAEQATARNVAMYAFFDSMPALNRAYCASPENGDVQFAITWEFKGAPPAREIICREQDIDDYRALVAQHPQNADALNALADLLGEAGRLDEALTLAEKALRLKKDSGMILDTYGWILLKQKRTPEAIDALTRASALLPDQPIVLYHLGAAYHDAGHEARGHELLAKALRIAPDFPGAEHARQLLAP